MEEPSHKESNIPELDNDDVANLRSSYKEVHNTQLDSVYNLKSLRDSSSSVSSDNESAPRKRIIKRIKRLSDSDSDNTKSREGFLPEAVETSLPKSKLSDSDSNISESIARQSRIQIYGNVSNSDESEREAPGHDKPKLRGSGGQSDKNESRVVDKSRIKRKGIFSGSEECENENPQTNETKLQSSESKRETIIFKSKPYKSRIYSNGNLSDSSKSESDNVIKNKEQHLRMKNKRNKLRDKFKNLVATRGTELAPANNEIGVNRDNDSDSPNESGDDMASIEKIKQIIKEKMLFKPSICDPDTSDEESGQQKIVYKPKKERKITKPTSPKPQRMSAKQAMENMQKIKSESNRMLREKEVSLPYHRPKALSLKDIMSRRKLAISADGKALPIKMNEHQLKQYAQMLEERHKEMMELCKSESEEEEKPNENPDEIEKDTATHKVNETNNDKQTALENENHINNVTDIDNHMNGDSVDELNESNDQNQYASENANNINDVTDRDNHMNGDSMEQDRIEKRTEGNVTIDDDPDNLAKQQDSETSMQLIYDDSANSLADDNLTIDPEEGTVIVFEEDNKIVDTLPKSTKEIETINNVPPSSKKHETEEYEDDSKPNTEVDSQLISLHFDTENTENSIAEELTKDTTKNTAVNKKSELPDTTTKAADDNIEIAETTNLENNISNQEEKKNAENEVMEVENEFSDDDLNIADIDNIIENAEIIKDIEDKTNSQFLVRDKPLNLNPKLTGAPGMVIDLDTDDAAPRKSGVELLKERFTYFAKLKTPEEFEREREKKLKPGTQLKKLKQELEEKMSDQRSLEWAKRLEDEKQQQKELKVLRGEESDEEDIDKIEAAIEGNEEVKDESEQSDSDAEEEPIENDIEIKDKPRIKNAMLDDEAEESDCDEDENIVKENDIDQNNENEDDDGIDGDNDDDDEEEDDSDSDKSSESEEEEMSTTKKGRILKAFEDSDDEDSVITNKPVIEIKEVKGTSESKSGSSVVDNFMESQIGTQDEELQLAQRHKTNSEDLFTSQESALLASEAKEKTKDIGESDETFTQTFSILESSKMSTAELDFNESGKLSAVCNTQSLEVSNLDDVSDMCPVTDSQNKLPLPSQIPTTQLSQSQPIGEDILALCTGKFYDNQFVSQVEENQVSLSDTQKYDAFDNFQSLDSQEDETYNSMPTVCNHDDIVKEKDNATDTIEPKETDFIELNTGKENRTRKVDDNLKSILDELADPEFDSPKQSKYFPGVLDTLKDSVENERHVKKKFILDSDDDETNEGNATENKRKKLKKKKPEKRALQISDDEEELSVEEELEEYETDVEEENPERIVDYDSEENEIELKPQNEKKKRKMAEFFEKEAELTSEDEWAGSGDEDEAGLDRMEREEGDDETFHQGKLQRELGQIHMRDVMDQDKREVRLIQELLFEDGDLGGGGRQRKFRWQNIDGEMEAGTVPDEFVDTQEEEFESEEQWRKQRHEREMFLRQMQNKEEPEESLNVTVNRSTIIKANLISKTMSSLLMEVNASDEKTEKTDNPVMEKKTAKDVPSPKKPFVLLQHNYQGSLLARGRGALARLAALATPLAADDAKVALGPTSRRNFVFATLTPTDNETKITKRKAESNPTTPKLVKKMRTEDKQNTSRNSLLDHFKL